MTTFFTSDWHFTHKNIVEFTDRKKIITQEEHDEWAIRLWNSQVNPEDTVFQLGDMVFNRKTAEAWRKFMYRLNGRIVNIKGNHDNYAACVEAGFEMHDYVEYTHTSPAGIKQHIVMSHYPMAVWNGSHRGTFMLHGHCHGSYRVAQGKILDVGLDSAYNILGEHRLFTFDDVSEYMSKRKIHCVDHHNNENMQ